ncbi:hypothetical protein BAT_2329 [Bacillus pumilus ATCC 7061]|nr:hypothetical protein BAT_2329 [Bacillus pumilus ATCC 7061]
MKQGRWFLFWRQLPVKKQKPLLSEVFVSFMVTHINCSKNRAA